MAVGAMFLLSLPAGLLQAYHTMPMVQGKSAVVRLALPVLAAPFNMGGVTVRSVHELIAGPPTRAGSFVASGAITHFHLYLPLLLIQVVALAAVFSRRMRQVNDFWDPVLIALAGAFLLNSLLNASWPWWGS